MSDEKKFKRGRFVTVVTLLECCPFSQFLVTKKLTFGIIVVVAVLVLASFWVCTQQFDNLWNNHIRSIIVGALQVIKQFLFNLFNLCTQDLSKCQETQNSTKLLNGRIAELEEKILKIEEARVVELEENILKIEEIRVTRLEKKTTDIENVLKKSERFLSSKTSFKKWSLTDDKTRQVLSISGTDVTFRLCPSGEFKMGSPLFGKAVVARYPSQYEEDSYKNDLCQHNVKLTYDFYLAEFPVTRGEFGQFVEEKKYQTYAEKIGQACTGLITGGYQKFEGINWRNPGFAQNDDHPVVCINYSDAEKYIAWLNEISDVKINGYKPEFRLPTEAEWEYACRAGTSTEFFWGDDAGIFRNYLNANGIKRSSDDVPGRKLMGKGGTLPVGSFRPNHWNLYDMLGNVWEWTADWYKRYSVDPITDPKNDTCNGSNTAKRVLRGGGME